MRCVLLSIVLAAPALAQWPAGFVTESLGAGWQQPVGLTFAEDGRMLVWEKAGRVWTVENGVKASTPLIDIAEEVGDWRDHGLLGFALDPQFLTNGRIYLAYTVDWHHLEHFGTPQYSETENAYFRDTIGRVTRYTANASDGFRSVDPASRLVLVGESKSSGVPSTHQSHGVGALAFGRDGSLLVATGDGASHAEVDIGQVIAGSSNTALAEGILRPAEAVGAWRAQLVDSLCGKLLRIDPESGDGLADNPFFDPAAPRAARSRVWALGLRNPFRFALLPDLAPPAGGPGRIVLGDVGWRDFEELSSCDAPGENFGWPLFEGLGEQPDYAATGVLNLDAPNPLAGAGCAAHFRFDELLVQDVEAAPSWPNPCDPLQQIPSSLARFEHARPWLEYGHGHVASAPIFSAGLADQIAIDEALAPLSGAPFDGDCVGALAWCASSSYPAPWQNTLFFADFSAGWMRSVEFDAAGVPRVLREFAPSLQAGAVVALTLEPASGELHFIDYDPAGQAEVLRLRWTPNAPPSAVATPAVSFGPSPLAVQFSSAGSHDPEGGALSFAWDFGDGSTSDEADPLHIYASAPGAPTPRRFDVTLTVTDVGGASASASAVVSTDNTPPQVVIHSPLDGSSYAVGGGSIPISLEAQVGDAEHAPSELSCEWRTTLVHDDHQHPEPPDPNCASVALLTPLGCDGDTYHYEFELTVTDAAGLSTVAVARVFPDCCAGGLTPMSYCTAKVNSLGCVPAIGSSGEPSLTSAAPFFVTCSNVISQRAGLLIYSFEAADWPFLGGRRCIAKPMRRTPRQLSGGSPAPSCDGAFAFDFNAWRATGLDPNLLVGRIVHAQYWFRDSAASFGAGLSDALRFPLCP